MGKLTAWNPIFKNLSGEPQHPNRNGIVTQWSRESLTLEDA